MIGNVITHEGRHHRDGNLGIGAARKSSDRRNVKPRPSLGYKKPAVPSKTGERRIDEAERRGLTPS